jgi:hypothetical protein
MKRLLLAAALALLALSSRATVLTFDDYPAVEQYGHDAIRDSYNGYVIGTNAAGGEALPYLAWIDTVEGFWGAMGAVSGHFTATNDWGGAGVIRKEDGTDFTFDSVWARAWEGDREATIRGFRGGVQVWSFTYDLTTEWTEIAGRAGAIDELQLDLGNYFLIDDVSLSPAQAPVQVPEPASLAIFGLGLAAAAALRRKRAS